MNLRATVTLVMAAVVMVAGIFAINMVTGPIIEQRENNKYIEIIPESTGFEPYQSQLPEPSLIRSIDLIDAGTRGEILAYQTSFKGWADGIEVIVFVYADRLDIAAVEVVSHNETAGIGDRLLENVDFVSQFNNQSGDDVLSLGIDSVAGVSAPVTLSAIENAIQEVLEFHQQERLGVVVEPESPFAPFDQYVPLVSAISDRSNVYNSQLDTSEVVETSLLLEGDTVKAVAYTVSFTGYNRSVNIELQFIFDHQSSQLLGVEIVSHEETPGYGKDILESAAVMAQLVSESENEIEMIRVDANAGVTMTTNGLRNAYLDIVAYHRETYLGIVVEDTTPPVIQVLARTTTFNEGDVEPDWASYFVVTNDEDSVDVMIDRGALDMNTPSTEPYVITATFTDTSGNVSTATLQITILPSEEVIEVVVTPPSQERVDLFTTLYATATLFNETTAQNVLAESMTNTYRIEEDEALLAVAYESLIDGFYPDSIRIIVFITPSGMVDQIYIISNNETRSYGGNLIADESFIDSFNQTSLTTPPEVDSYTGATVTRDAIVESVTSTLTYHQETFTE
jgi:Na+-translocating ferredoxin:NAD+ oxidoreductase RnfG subunit